MRTILAALERRRLRLGADRAGDAARQEPAGLQGLAALIADGARARISPTRCAGICGRRPGRQRHDFVEGVRALLIDKDKPATRRNGTPDRHPSRRGGGRDEMLDVLFAPLRPNTEAWTPFPELDAGSMSEYDTILVEQRGAVTLVTLNRPQALNALNSEVLKELIDAFRAYDADDGQRCLVLTGSERAFAAGADIKEMSSQGFADMYSSNFFAGWEKVTATRKPWIAAVAGYALGGGCEVAMMADFIIAADTAKFGQPEIKLGVTPGMGGSQRLTRAVGKAKAMEMCLTGRMMDAEEAERSGLVAGSCPRRSCSTRR
jgi:enoyl-CoA hydratase